MKGWVDGRMGQWEPLCVCPGWTSFPKKGSVTPQNTFQMDQACEREKQSYKNHCMKREENIFKVLEDPQKQDKIQKLEKQSLTDLTP